MVTIDIVVIGYRSESFIPRLFSDLEGTTKNPHKLYYFDNTGNPKTLSAAWNEMAGKGQGEYLAIMNPDVALSPSWDDRLLRCLSSDPSTGIATADPSPFSLTAPSKEVMSEISKQRASRTDVGLDPVQFFLAFMKRQHWEALRGVDERMRFYMQDIDFIVRMNERLKKRTVRVFSCPIWHHGSASTRRAGQLGEIDAQVECDFGSRVFDQVHRGILKEWQLLSESERRQIRTSPLYSKIPCAVK